MPNERDISKIQEIFLLTEPESHTHKIVPLQLPCAKSTKPISEFSFYALRFEILLFNYSIFTSHVLVFFILLLYFFENYYRAFHRALTFMAAIFRYLKKGKT